MIIIYYPDVQTLDFCLAVAVQLVLKAYIEFLQALRHGFLYYKPSVTVLLFTSLEYIDISLIKCFHFNSTFLPHVVKNTFALPENCLICNLWWHFNNLPIVYDYYPKYHHLSAKIEYEIIILNKIINLVCVNNRFLFSVLIFLLYYCKRQIGAGQRA